MEHWNAYWHRNPSVDSFGDVQSAFTDHSQVANYWRSALQGVNDGDVMVDIGSGNGALALFFAKYSQQENLTLDIHAVDLAILDLAAVSRNAPALKPLISKISVHQETSATALPFPDHSVNYVVSQFGFEYMPMVDVLREAKRVLKPGGKFITLMHHQDSQVTRDSQVGCDVLNFALQASPLFSDAQAYLESSGQEEQQLKAKLMAQFNDLQQRFSAEGEAWTVDITRRLAQLFQQRQLPTVQRVEALRLIKQQFLSSFRRSKEQVAAALNNSDVNELVRLAEGEGLTNEALSELEINNRPIAWVLSAAT